MKDTSISLWWKLSWQLSLVLFFIITIVIMGLCIYGLTVLTPNLAIEKNISHLIRDAVTRDAQGRFVIRDTPNLNSFKAQYSDLWYVAATVDGAYITYGAVPTPYSALAPYVHFFRDADIRGAAGTNEIASIEPVNTRVGKVSILIGGVAGKGWPFLVLLKEIYPIYLPLLALALPAVFLAVPRIVQRTLSGVRKVAKEASEIEAQSFHARLPVSEIPKEIVPLVTAFNGLLGRLDDEFHKRQRFLLDAAHELRTPIAIIQARIEGLQAGQHRVRLLDDVARLNDTAEQLLDFERNTQGAELHQNINLVEIASNVVADLAPLAIAAGYTVSFQSETEYVERFGNPSDLSRAISNLFRNAVDHGENRGMIHVTVSAGGDITVADEGPGIPVEHQQLVFEPFYRITPRSTGAGLGLSLVKQIVANHHGHVTIGNASPGTQVTIEL
ncbi:sensor histidine kinase [Phyllobacterium myrsinacearum]|uniref:histidine kinase n=1 Tax=Phyllobacterium myrsinacearum TaxID=28101 RepID=A0A839ELQ0_9HYPH|nr:HAMP domain-containing sensor histidine kinase [Phyllobacterium myrsinacearum]MBA8881453.1 signal transduction histidine kinase [Phyllobacterium myrsinacearum]